MAKLRQALQSIAGEIDPEQLKTAERLQSDAWSWKPVERLPVLLLDVSCPDWPLYPYGETFDHPEKMLWNELLQVHTGVRLRDDRVLAIRPHFGSGVIASFWFGARLIPVEGNVPWTEPVAGRAAIQRIIERGVPDLNGGLAGRVRRAVEVYRDYLDEYAPLRRHVHVFVCDTQGPLDTALLLWGPAIYLAMYEDPLLVHALLDVITETTIAFTRMHKRLIGESLTEAWHFWYRVPGGVRVVDDVGMNLSPAMYAKFSRPYNERVLAAFGGGCMHYCGHKLKTQSLRLGTKGLRGIEMGFDNPRRNPGYAADPIWKEAQAHEVALLWIAERMPHVRPVATTDLVYGCRLPRIPWSEAPESLKR